MGWNIVGKMGYTQIGSFKHGYADERKKCRPKLRALEEKKRDTATGRSRFSDSTHGPAFLAQRCSLSRARGRGARAAKASKLKTLFAIQASLRHVLTGETASMGKDRRDFGVLARHISAAVQPAEAHCSCWSSQGGGPAQRERPWATER
jgi:hypothetical protein